MELVTYLSFFGWMIILIVLSYLTDYLLALIFKNRSHRLFVWLGVIVHEYSHALGCLLTRTKIKEIKLFESTGGHVTHQKVGPFRTAVIAIAPLFGCSAFLLLLAWLFGKTGVSFEVAAISATSFFASFIAILTAVGTNFWNNVVIDLGVVTLFFFLFVYLVGSVAAAIAPSGADFKNGLLGMIIFGLLGTAVVYFKPLGYIPQVMETFNTATPAIDFVVKWLLYAISVGILGVFIILAILIPVAIIKRR